MNHHASIAIAAGLLLAGPQALAWGPDGHRAVGTIADRLIAGTPAAVQTRKILGSNLRTASVWADCAKGVNTSSFKYEGAGHFAECAVYENPASEHQMEAYVRRNLDNCTSPHNSEVCHKQYHYTDVAVQRAEYRKGYVGTSEQDIVAAINAAIAVLQDREPPPPFRIVGKKEALRLLAHYVGDIHQPLHVAAVYVDAKGKVIDPDEGAFDPKTETHGGNDLLIKVSLPAGVTAKPMKFHALWDKVSGSANFDQPSAAVLTQARAVAVTPGEPGGWATAWATESLKLGTAAYRGVSYSAANASHQHVITLPAGYGAEIKTPAQREQVIKAGARLAQLVTAIWPE